MLRENLDFSLMLLPFYPNLTHLSRGKQRKNRKINTKSTFFPHKTRNRKAKSWFFSRLFSRFVLFLRLEKQSLKILRKTFAFSLDFWRRNDYNLFVVLRHALVAQLDRVLDYESRGQGFESLRARQNNGYRFCGARYFLCVRRDSKPERVSGVKKTVLWTVFNRESEVVGEVLEDNEEQRRACADLSLRARQKEGITFW